MAGADKTDTRFHNSWYHVKTEFKYKPYKWYKRRHLSWSCQKFENTYKLVRPGAWKLGRLWTWHDIPISGMLLKAGIRNGERGTGNGERGTGNGERKIEHGRIMFFFKIYCFSCGFLSSISSDNQYPGFFFQKHSMWKTYQIFSWLLPKFWKCKKICLFSICKKLGNMWIHFSVTPPL